MYSYKNNILEFIIINSYVVHIVIIICVLYIFTVYLLGWTPGKTRLFSV